MHQPRQQFGTLEALRGVAALGVMVFHAPLMGAQLMPGGYLAVDLFFMLSGFVIAHAYQQRMATGLGLRSFIRARAIRLWPMLALGALLGIVLFGGHVGAILLVPNFMSPMNLYPANPALWSLLAEMLAYMAFALGLWRLSTKALLLLAIVAAVYLLRCVLSDAIYNQIGSFWSTALPGIARVILGFCIGMVMCRVWHRRQPAKRATWLAWLPLAGCIAIMALVPKNATVVPLLATIIALPPLLWLALRWELPQISLGRKLGHLSYPLYCIHMPLLIWLVSDIATLVACLIALPLVSLALHSLLDEPARKYLTRLLKPAPAPDQTRIGINT